MRKYVIFSEMETAANEGEPMFWCNDDEHGWSGWGCLETATVFEEETEYLPLGGAVIYLPQY